MCGCKRPCEHYCRCRCHEDGRGLKPKPAPAPSPLDEVKKALEITPSEAPVNSLGLPWLVASDLPMYAIMATGGYRVVCSANQNNERHFDASKTWAGIPDGRIANAIATVMNNAKWMVARIEELERENAELRGEVK